MVFGIGDELSVQVSAQTADFQAGMEAAESGLSDVERTAATAAGALQLLQGRADEAGDEMRDVGRDSTIASLGLGNAASSALGAEISFGSLSVVTAVSLIPALIALSSALAPVVASLGGLAAIGASIGLVGLLPAIGAIATNTEQLKSEFTDLLDVVRSEFAPVFDRATAVLGALISEFADIVPALVPTADEIDRLGDLFFGLGQDIINALPALTELAVELTSEFLPALVSMTDTFTGNLPGAIENFVSIFERMIPFFVALGAELGRLLPEITRFGFTVLRVVSPALGALSRGLTNVLAFVNDLDGGVSSLVARWSILAPILAAIATTLGGPVALALGAVVAAVIGLRKAFQTNFASIRDYFTGLWNEVQDTIPAIQRAFSAFIAGVDFDELISKGRELARVYGNQLMNVLEDLRPVFDRLQTFFNDNQEEFEILGNVINRIAGAFLDLAAIMVQAIGPAFENVIVPALMLTIDAVDAALGRVTDLITAFGQIEEGNYQAALETVTRVDVEEAGQRFAEIRSGDRPPVPTNINVTVEGDTDVVRDVTAEEIQNQKRETVRNTGGVNTVR